MMTFGLRHTWRSQNSSRWRRSHGDIASVGPMGDHYVTRYCLITCHSPAPPPRLSVLSTPSPSPVFPLPYDNQNVVSIHSRSSDVSRTPCPCKAYRKKESWGHAHDGVKGSGPVPLRPHTHTHVPLLGKHQVLSEVSSLLQTTLHTCYTIRVTASPARVAFPPTNFITHMLHNSSFTKSCQRWAPSYNLSITVQFTVSPPLPPLKQYTELFHPRQQHSEYQSCIGHCHLRSLCLYHLYLTLISSQ